MTCHDDNDALTHCMVNNNRADLGGHVIKILKKNFH